MTSITANTQFKRLARAARLARGARKARALSVPVLVAGALAAGCGTTHAPASTGANASASVPQASATPVPTVTGGTVTVGEPACVGWPAGATSGTLTAFFNPVAVERCVTGFQKGPGKVEWQTATLEKATKGLTPLVAALLRSPARHQPGIACPELAILPPQVVLISSAGKMLIPRLPLSGCGLADSGVFRILATLTWEPVSVRLVSKLTGSQPLSTAPRATSPKTIQTLPVSVPPNQAVKPVSS
jgi:hypothetical protein